MGFDELTRYADFVVFSFFFTANRNLVHNQLNNGSSNTSAGNYNLINNNVSAGESTLTASLTGPELASAERRTGVSSTPCTPQSQRHVRSRRKEPPGGGANGLHSVGIGHGFGPQSVHHPAGGAVALLKGGAL